MEIRLESYSKEDLIALIKEHQDTVAKLEQKVVASESKTAELEGKAVELESKATELKEANIYLKYQLEQLKRLIYGQKRERFEHKDNGQLSLPFLMNPEQKEQLDDKTVEEVKKEVKRRNTHHRGRRPLPEHLEVEEIHIHPEGDLSEMACIGQEVSDVLEYLPARYFIKRYIRYKYAPKNKEGVLIGQLPYRAIEKCMAGSGLIASILVDKYMDHLPLHRQVQRFKREKIPIPPSTVDGWVRQGIDLIDILYQHLRETTKAKGYLQADETPVKVLDQHKKGSTHQGYYWAYHCPIDKTVLFDYQPGRSTKAAANILEGFKGYLQTDGYEVYESYGKQSEVTHLNCWAHARREFERALDNDKPRAQTALSYIGELYKVERQAREDGANCDQRKRLRLDKSLPIITAFGKWLYHELQSGVVLPKSQIGKAFGYTLNRWEKLSAYLYDGLLEIDNNLIENQIRPIAIGRKNYLFAGSHKGAQRAASIYSFFAICKLHEVNPYEWLKYVFDNIEQTKVSNLEKLYPQNYKAMMATTNETA